MFINFLSKKNTRKLQLLNDILGLNVFSEPLKSKVNRDYHELMDDIKRNNFDDSFDMSNIQFVFIGKPNMKFMILNKLWGDYLLQSAMYQTMREIVIQGKVHIPYLENKIQYSIPYIYSMIDKMNRFPEFKSFGIEILLEKGDVRIASDDPFRLYFFILMWYKQTPIDPIIPIKEAMNNFVEDSEGTPIDVDEERAELLKVIAPDVQTQEEFYVMLCSYFYNDHHGIEESYKIGNELLKLDNDIVRGITSLIINFQESYKQIIDRDFGIYIYSLVMFILLYGQSEQSLEILKGHLSFYSQLSGEEEAVSSELLQILEKSQSLDIFQQNAEVYTVMISDISPILEATTPQPRISIFLSIKESPFLELLVRDSIINNFNENRFEFTDDESIADAFIIDRFNKEHSIEKQYVLKNYISEITNKGYLEWLVHILLHFK